MKKLSISLALALGILVPAFALAQSTNAGLLTVYVQVLNQNNGTYQSYSPSNFTVQVYGQSPSLTSFPGSQSGTSVTLNPGIYNVTISNTIAGVNPSYSTGCNNTMLSGGSQTCVVTVSPAYNYNQYPSVYPYQNLYQPLTCRTVTPTVGLGQQASFNAVGGQGGTYNWSTAYQNYPNVGPTLTAAFQASGSQVVTVTNANQTATCTITVTNSYTPSVVTPVPTYGTPGYVAPGYTGYPSYTSVVYPRLPSTGFGPKDISTGIAFAIVGLIAVGLITAPYVRKTVTALSR